VFCEKHNLITTSNHYHALLISNKIAARIQPVAASDYSNVRFEQGNNSVSGFLGALPKKIMTQGKRTAIAAHSLIFYELKGGKGGKGEAWKLGGLEVWKFRELKKP
jgi:hypothetical protein